MGFFRYSNIFSYLFELNNISPGILKEKIDEKKYFLEWGSNPRKYYVFRAEIFVRFLVQLKTAKSPFEIN